MKVAETPSDHLSEATHPEAQGLTTAILAGIGTAVGVLYVLALTGLGQPAPNASAAVPAVASLHMPSLSEHDTASARALDGAFERMGYQLDQVAEGEAEVPRVFLSSLPGDIVRLPEPDSRKQVFLRAMLPLVLAVNEEIASDRARLVALAKRTREHQPISEEDRRWLADMAERYEVSRPEPQRLLRRVDVVPPSLALAQAAEESGWGTSRLVRRENNLFGHTAQDEDEAAARMRRFPTLMDAVRAYIHNLNTHRAYDDLRRARSYARAKGLSPDGYTLAGAMEGYSERGRAYVRQLRTIIRANALGKYDGARLVQMAGQVASARPVEVGSN